MIGIAVLLAMALAPALIWLAFRHFAPDRAILRVAGASILPPVMLIAAIMLDFVLNGSPADGFVAPHISALVFMFELLFSIGIAGVCEARFGPRQE